MTDVATPHDSGVPVHATRYALVFVIGLALLSTLMLVRASYGMEWLGDDAYTLTTAMRYVQGDRPIVDSWETHLTSDMVVSAVVWAIHAITPDWTGLVLHYRYVFVLLQAIYAFFVWRLLQGLMPPLAAVLTSWVAFAYLPYYYVLLNYNSIMIAAFTLATLTLLRAFAGDAPRRWMIIASGVACGVGVIVYPTMLLAMPFFIAGIWGVNRGRAVKPIAWFLGGLSAALVAFAVVTLLWAGTAHIAEVLPLFIHPGDRDMSLVAIFARFNRTRAVLGASIVSALVFSAVALLLRRWPERYAVALAGAIFASVTTVIIAVGLPHSLLYYMDIPQSCALGIGTALLLLVLVHPDSYYRRLFWLLCLPTIGLAIGAGVASLEGFETASMSSIIVAIAGFLALAHAVAVARLEGASRSLEWLVPVAIGAVLLLFVVTDSVYHGGDADITQLSARITQGAYAGIRTTPANARLHAHYVRVFEPVKAAGGRTAFLEAFPTGYLITGVQPGAYSVWSNYAHGDRWQRYLDITGNYPTTIVATRISGPNGGLVDKPFAPPLGLRDFGSKYVEIYRDADFVIYRIRAKD